jgi:hypothetical protein
MMPVLAASVSPAGSPVAENMSGACPEAGIANKNGVAAFDENVNGAWSSGAAGGGVIEMLIVVCARAVPHSTSAIAMAPTVEVRIPHLKGFLEAVLVIAL